MSKLLFLKDNVKDKDIALKEFTQDRMEEEVFFQITGLGKTYKRNELLIEFYVRDKTIVTWEEIRKAISAFEIKDNRLIFSKRNFKSKLGTTLFYIYFGVGGLSSGFMILYGLINKKDNGISFLFFILFVLTIWMITTRKTQIDAKKIIAKH